MWLGIPNSLSRSLKNVNGYRDLLSAPTGSSPPPDRPPDLPIDPERRLALSHVYRRRSGHRRVSALTPVSASSSSSPSPRPRAPLPTCLAHQLSHRLSEPGIHPLSANLPLAGRSRLRLVTGVPFVRSVR
ncbi:hypothetical protein ASPZODRAFT_17204 [Penicilliopsis zonata CBS 506.65]|uniref:Uncharacterized protein n=1 Tax=Penicilliopsis zonata CBS 506.65 TaxID=1073090 RepID=A0A1L9SF38_9EURO|nr:hypothetical protein ASPZODRAFT_17204 [Penicilliopsis zonata CBS 506.65]OJJ45762.1 hypothetical protein ASPZODRAFT_17204 [Penicilliopsis zonata CBS 506.65]